MKTVLTHSPEEAAEFVRGGGIVAFPTETVYGLGANVFDANAVGRIFEAKRRPADNPLIAHVEDLRQINGLTPTIGQDAKKFIDAFFPGPLTLVLTKRDEVPLIATAGLETIGVRMPRYEPAARFIRACGVPVVAPSANLSGRPSPTTWQAVLEDLDGRIDCILQGNATEIGLESTVVDCSGPVPVLLRCGAVSLEELREVAPNTVSSERLDSEISRSPGIKHRHYKPTARVQLVECANDAEHVGMAYIGLDQNAVRGHFTLARVCGSVEEYAHELFEFFRKCDRVGISTIYCEEVPETGIGAALMDRLRRSAQS